MVSTLSGWIGKTLLWLGMQKLVAAETDMQGSTREKNDPDMKSNSIIWLDHVQHMLRTKFYCNVLKTHTRKSTTKKNRIFAQSQIHDDNRHTGIRSDGYSRKLWDGIKRAKNKLCPWMCRIRPISFILIRRCSAYHCRQPTQNTRSARWSAPRRAYTQPKRRFERKHQWREMNIKCKSKQKIK